MQRSKISDKHNEIPIEEFENDKQEFREDFIGKFKKEEKVEKSEQEDLTNKGDYTKWL